MTRIRPFQALRYDTTKLRLADVIVPPYDVIAAADREGYFTRDPHNAIRLELTRRVEDEARADYSDVRRTLETWTRSGVLVRDPRPAFYALRQSFSGPDGKARRLATRPCSSLADAVLTTRVEPGTIRAELTFVRG